MSRAMLDELRQISREITAISKRAEQAGRMISREEQDALDQLSMARDELTGDMIFHAYG